jgi:hypothetical protein
MRGVLFVAAALTCGLALGSTKVSAAPVSGLVALSNSGLITNVDYYHGHHHFHHRRWDHGHWRYWD